jgi:Na+/H+-dicarboxylate symporter
VFLSPWTEHHFYLQTSLVTFFVARDRFRTMINVLGDSIGAGIVDHLSKSELLKLGQPNSDADKVDPQNGKLNAEDVEWHTTAM